MSILSWCRDHITNRFRLDRERRKLVVDDAGLKLIEAGEIRYWIAWKNVRRIDAYKGDLVMAELLCLAFEYDDDTFCEVTERMEGFNALAARLPYLFPGFDPTWPAKVAQPGLAKNRMEVWRAG